MGRKLLPGRALSGLLLPMIMLIASPTVAITYDESVLGDLPESSQFGNEPPVLELGSGTHQVLGSARFVESLFGPGSGDRDAFWIALAPGKFLASASVTYAMAIGDATDSFIMEHVLFEDPPSSIRSFATSTSQLRNGDTGTLALFEDALPTDRGSVFEVWLTGIPISIDGSGTFQYDYTIELVVVPEPATGLMVGLGLAAMTLRRRT